MYVGKVIAKSGWLLGGVKVHETSRMESRKDCVQLCETYISINKGAGRDAAMGEVQEVT